MRIWWRPNEEVLQLTFTHLRREKGPRHPLFLHSISSGETLEIINSQRCNNVESRDRPYQDWRDDVFEPDRNAHSSVDLRVHYR